MKRWLSILFVTLVIMLSTAPIASALPTGLHDNGDGTITDYNTNLMWLQDGQTSGSITWDGAVAWADTLDFAGHTDWRLPSTVQPDPGCNFQRDYIGGDVPDPISNWRPDGIIDTSSGWDCTGSEMGNLFYNSLGNTAQSQSNMGPFTNIAEGSYRSGTEYAPNTSWAWAFVFDYGKLENIGFQGSYVKGSGLYALAVRDITDPAPVPEPSTILLLGSGLVGLVLLRKKQNKTIE